MLRHTIRGGRVVAGAVLVVLGVLLSLPGVPGPGLLIVFGGLGVLGTEFEWARRLRDRIRLAVLRSARRITGRTHGG